MQLASIAQPRVAPAGTPIGTIAHPARRIPPLAMIATDIVGPATGWATLDDAVAGVVELTRPLNVPMLAVMHEGDRYVARLALVNVSLRGDNWGVWHLENASDKAGPASIDWTMATGAFQALIDGRTRILRP